MGPPSAVDSLHSVSMKAIFYYGVTFLISFKFFIRTISSMIKLYANATRKHSLGYY